jgi:Protein SET DOMAIN GROUP 2 C-terminal/SET domain
VVEQAQQTFGLKPVLPDFYNILLERPRQDPNGYGLLYVDASQKANLGSSCSHSCNSNCTSAVVARNGRLVIVLTTSRYISPGEELTMDYYSVTTSDVEWRSAICLCGQSACRGSFLHYATQDDLQQVLNQSCGPLWRYASLLRACAGRPLSEADIGSLDRHGMRSAAIGKHPQPWLQKYAADNLRFVEFERKALPCALMRPSNGQRSLYSYSAADMDARSVMEQRLQAMVCCFSMVQRVLARQPVWTVGALGNTSATTSTTTSSANTTQGRSSSSTGTASNSNSNSSGLECGSEGLLPIRAVPSGEAAERVWRYLSAVPALMEVRESSDSIGCSSMHLLQGVVF